MIGKAEKFNGGDNYKSISVWSVTVDRMDLKAESVVQNDGIEASEICEAGEICDGQHRAGSHSVSEMRLRISTSKAGNGRWRNAKQVLTYMLNDFKIASKHLR